MLGLSVIVMRRQRGGLDTLVAVETWKEWGIMEGVIK